MDITETKVKIRDLIVEYADNGDEGVTAYDGKLDVRPPYQREFVYNEKQERAVINSIMKGFPLNTLYWNKTGEDTYEVLDGQQRTLSICHYVNGQFDLNFQYFHNLEEDQKNQILDYELTVYVCEGDDSEKLKWFEVINTVGSPLNAQELRNAVYQGEWLTECKRRFSKTGGPAVSVGEGYMKGAPIRQDYLETVLRWISNGAIEAYMAQNQEEGDYEVLWNYYRDVIQWAKVTFPQNDTIAQDYNKLLMRADWGSLYNSYKDTVLNLEGREDRLRTLLADEDVTKRSGVFEYFLSGDEKVLNIRAFSAKEKTQMYARQEGICPSCGEHFDIGDMEGDHIVPWSDGGKTNLDNGQMLCRPCNRAKAAGL